MPPKKEPEMTMREGLPGAALFSSSGVRPRTSSAMERKLIAKWNSCVAPDASVTVALLAWSTHCPALLTRMWSSGSAFTIVSTVRRHCSADETSQTYVDASMPACSTIFLVLSSFSGLRETRTIFFGFSSALVNRSTSDRAMPLVGPVMSMTLPAANDMRDYTRSRRGTWAWARTTPTTPTRRMLPTLSPK